MFISIQTTVKLRNSAANAQWRDELPVVSTSSKRGQLAVYIPLSWCSNSTEPKEKAKNKRVPPEKETMHEGRQQCVSPKTLSLFSFLSFIPPSPWAFTFCRRTSKSIVAEPTTPLHAFR